MALQETAALGRVFEAAAIKNAAQVEAKAPFLKRGLKKRGYKLQPRFFCI